MKTEKVHKKPQQLERYFKGASNSRRIEILLLLSEKAGLTLEEMSRMLKANIKTLHEHSKRLYQAGLINKRRDGAGVSHSLSPYGKEFVAFMKTFK